MNSFDEAVSSYTPPPAQITFTDAYQARQLLRMQVLNRNHEHPAINLTKITEAFSHLMQASDRAAAAMRFMLYELEVTSQLEDLAHAAFVGPDDDATEDDMIYSDQYDTDTGEQE